MAETSYDKNTGSYNYQLQEGQWESFGEEDQGGQTPDQVMGEPGRKLCKFMAFSPSVKSPGVHCNNPNHADHKGMEGAAHKGLSLEVRGQLRQHFRLG